LGRYWKEINISMLNKKAAFKRSGFLVAVGGGIEPP
jgi:hypothetical protein